MSFKTFQRNKLIWILCFDCSRLFVGSPDSTSCSQGFLHDDCTKAVTESGSQVEPSLVEMHQETDRILDAELNPHDGRLRQIQECDGRITEVDALANYMQDASQISGPDGRSRATPLSQIGFRDPASIGAGEQLTLLSLEVNYHCIYIFLYCRHALFTSYLDNHLKGFSIEN